MKKCSWEYLSQQKIEGKMVEEKGQHSRKKNRINILGKLQPQLRNKNLKK